jgi:hypothetical protein
VVPGAENRKVLAERYGANLRRVDVIPYSASHSLLAGSVAAHMGDGVAAPSRGDSAPWTLEAPESEETAWIRIAESYNHSFLKAIMDVQPAKRTSKMHPWPWCRMHEYAVSEGCAPGWYA